MRLHEHPDRQYLLMVPLHQLDSRKLDLNDS